MRPPSFKGFFDDPLGAILRKDTFLDKTGNYIDATAEIKQPVVLEGPYYIGPGCRIGPFSYIRPGSYLERNNRIGMSEIKNSMILGGSNAPHFNYVGDSLIGRGCNLGAGAKTANLRLDGGPIRILDQELRKFGAVIGNGVQIGINVNMRPGEFIPHGSLVYNDDRTGKRVVTQA